MVELKVEVDDWDTGETVPLTLPCDLRGKIDTSHELQIIDWDGFISIGYYNDIKKLNEVLEEINTECPALTLELLDKILDASGAYGLDDEDFVKKLCGNDFMFEEIVGTDNWLISTDEEKCACYLATEMYIPFAKNITEEHLDEIKDDLVDVIQWDTVWRYYEHMGFKIIDIDNRLYILHWGDAMED